MEKGGKAPRLRQEARKVGCGYSHARYSRARFGASLSDLRYGWGGFPDSLIGDDRLGGNEAEFLGSLAVLFVAQEGDELTGVVVEFVADVRRELLKGLGRGGGAAEGLREVGHGRHVREDRLRVLENGHDAGADDPLHDVVDVGVGAEFLFRQPGAGDGGVGLLAVDERLFYDGHF